MNFSKKKFLLFSKKQQHKKLFELLSLFLKKGDEEFIQHYLEISTWLALPPLQDTSFETLSNAYHAHLKKSGLGIREHNFLSSSKTQDRSSPLSPSLNYTIYLDNLRSTHNVGSILRTTEAFQLGTVLFSPATPSWNHPQVIKTAMGTADWISCKKVDHPSKLPNPLIAIETHPSATPYTEFTFPPSCTIAVGNEERGCSDLVIHQADVCIHIPMRGRKTSLNVANTFSIIAAEVVRQHES